MGRYATTGLWSSEGFLIKWPESVFEPLACFTFCTCCLQSFPRYGHMLLDWHVTLIIVIFLPWLQPQTVQINRSWFPFIYANFYHFFLVAESKTANENNFRVSVRNIFVTAEANNPMQNGKYKQWIIAFFFFLHQTFDVHHKTNSLQFDWQLISSWGSRAAAALGQPAVPTSPAPWIWKAKHLHCRHFCLFFFSSCCRAATAVVWRLKLLDFNLRKQCCHVSTLFRWRD